MRVLVLDPSSTAVGWAVFDLPVDSEAPSAFGVVKPPKSRKGRKLDALDRACILCKELVPELMAGLGGIDLVVAEVSTRRMPVHKLSADRQRRESHAQGDIGAYMFAAGMVVASAMQRVEKYDFVDSSVWTMGRRKERRCRDLELTSGGRYKMEDDPGGDAGDAWNIGLFWIRKNIDAIG